MEPTTKKYFLHTYNFIHIHITISYQSATILLNCTALLVVDTVADSQVIVFPGKLDKSGRLACT